MNVLGISGVGYHDSSAAIVCDGTLVAAAEEERFTRQKHDAAVPLQAAAYCLREAGLSMDDVDVLAVPELPFRVGPDSYVRDLPWRAVASMLEHGRAGPRTVASKLAMDFGRLVGRELGNRFIDRQTGSVLRSLRTAFGRVPPIRYYDHHKCHAASTFFTSGETEAAVVTIDGGGGPFAAVTWHGVGSQLRRTAAVCLPNSLGCFFEESTLYLGLGAFGEGKLMGLAAYGDPASFVDRIAGLLDLPGASWYRYRSAPNPRNVGFPPRRASEDVLRAPYPDFAAAVQARLEEAVTRIATDAMAAAGTRVLCTAGGVMLNCSLNGRLATSGIADLVWVFPAPGDAGLTVGAALLAAAESGELGPRRLERAYLGPAFTSQDCEAALRDVQGVTYWRSPDVASDTADLLARGDVVGRLQGRMEFGPRALGNRSILADPRHVSTRDRVNRIKRREAWRPLAPMVAAEHASEFFETVRPSPFMLFAYQVRPAQRAVVAAVVHADGSARPQTVTCDQNPALRSLLDAFALRTGVPVLLNTSFNDAGEPIVCAPADAIRTFLATDLDALVLEDIVVTKVSDPATKP